MSLLDNFTEPFIIMNKAKVSDDEGGYSTEWTDGAEIQAAIVLDSSTAARVAEREGVTNLYTITTSKAIQLNFHDVIKRSSDGAMFRITSDGTDKKTPDTATLDMRQVSAEKWTLTS